MTENLQTNLKCDLCPARAKKRLTFGILISDALKVGFDFRAPYESQQMNLCESHLISANVTYVHYKEEELTRNEIEEKSGQYANSSYTHR